jgi:hypothetical protein
MPAPGTLRLNDGFATLVTFSGLPGAKFYEKTVTPPSFNIGKSIDTTTMHNAQYRTIAAAKLKSTGNMKLVCAYATDVILQIQAILGQIQLITVTFPDTSTLAFYGYIDSFTPGTIEEGKQPTADVEIIATNTKTSGTEASPVYTGT